VSPGAIRQVGEDWLELRRGLRLSQWNHSQNGDAHRAPLQSTFRALSLSEPGKAVVLLPVSGIHRWISTEPV